MVVFSSNFLILSAKFLYAQSTRTARARLPVWHVDFPQVDAPLGDGPPELGVGPHLQEEIVVSPTENTQACFALCSFDRQISYLYIFVNADVLYFSLTLGLATCISPYNIPRQPHETLQRLDPALFPVPHLLGLPCLQRELGVHVRFRGHELELGPIGVRGEVVAARCLGRARRSVRRIRAYFFKEPKQVHLPPLRKRCVDVGHVVRP